ncbi:hypothetical protein DY000_02020835 [Brassica cretica]|uniref:Uncharacterized protein n=1 Tax=Brassica cretica TaxID=69181 RepID=A0ABQ7ECH6_BRACR|nr:hypothetical protein DY000_02020835 [Brassica cretica]
MEYFRKVIILTEGRKGKNKPPLGGEYKDREVKDAGYPGPLENLGFPIFPKSMEIDSANFSFHISLLASLSSDDKVSLLIDSLDVNSDLFLNSYEFLLSLAP